MGVPRLLIDLKLDCSGDIVGRTDISADSPFVLECLAEIIRRFSSSCEVPYPEILHDLLLLEKL